MLPKLLLVIAAIILICVFLNRISSKLGIPVLLLFILLGISFGWSDSQLYDKYSGAVEQVCTAALIFIMFFGGFGTRWKSARPIVAEASILATIGVFMTAAVTGVFCHFAFRWSWPVSLLMGSVISSTDAASVFSILRRHKLGLKNNTAPMLEMESGSNDPCSYMLTAVMLSVFHGTATVGMVVWTIVSQIAFGLIFGVLIALVVRIVLGKFNIASTGMAPLFFLAVAVASYALPAMVGGNGYLSTYITGIILGNTSFQGRKDTIGFFDGITNLMQILIFFLLGFMCIPEKLISSMLPALAIFLFLTLIGRPLTVFSILAPFRKYKSNQMGLISFVGLRGAASIVFAIMTIPDTAAIGKDIFSIVFCIVLISISLQGSLIPLAANAFKMTDSGEDVMSTFTDYAESVDESFGSIYVSSDSSWNGKKVKDLNLPKYMLLAVIIRGKEKLVPKGDTVIKEGDRVIICTHGCPSDLTANLIQHTVTSGSSHIGDYVRNYKDKNSILLLVKRGNESIIPDGNTKYEEDDVLVILELS